MTTPTITGISHIDLTVTDLERSEAFYADLFGMSQVLDGRNDDQHLSSRYLVHPASLLILGLVQHDSGHGGFDERHIGLDHLSFNVTDREELEAWKARLIEHDVAHSNIAESDLGDVLVFRDPDNIQLELFYMKPAAAELLVS
jgi:glyoxylase I family protein